LAPDFIDVFIVMQDHAKLRHVSGTGLSVTSRTLYMKAPALALR
jgi:hypothetical protein